MNPVNLKKRYLDLLKGHYNQQFGVKYKSKTETKRLSKAKNDIRNKITNSMDAFMLLSEVIKISNITPNKSSDQNTKYIRENYTDLNSDIVKIYSKFQSHRRRVRITTI